MLTFFFPSKGSSRYLIVINPLSRYNNSNDFNNSTLLVVEYGSIICSKKQYGC